MLAPRARRQLKSRSPKSTLEQAPRPEGRVIPLIADRAYDSDPLRQRLAQQGWDVICPHRKGRKRKATQDGRKLRRYRRRWIIERTIGWLGNFRRLIVRHEYYSHLSDSRWHFITFSLACTHAACETH
jgi:transposase